MPLASHPRRILVIFNPTSGPRRRRRLDGVLQALAETGCIVTLRDTKCRGDAEIIARDADPREFDLVAVAGGDGTINEVINGLADSPVPLALIPLGTANVLANEIGLPRDARAIAQAISGGRSRAIYLGQANGHRFAMMLGVGIDARIVEGIDLRLKRRAGKLAYVASGIVAVLRYRPVRYDIEIDGRPYRAAGVIIANGHFYGGRFVVARAARLETPSLHAALMERPGRWNILRYGLAIAFGRVERLRDVRIVEGRQIIVRGPNGEAVQADGDLDGALPLEIAVTARPLAVICG